ncbi:pyrroline-5-carboxylate reductase [Hahella chejuensis KCTC 2396]|uniref:Pyrroline-5-carboxylate reductase n=1 Tax=Hahella chejuensis (strain KCTC 2396) TaxID=349521 RepID=Q2S8M4_HAHCH|nr:pyrroline-5-carboxylate reductase [Hahella chejuensis]ABC33000.1 pyrroline-5-carboxylate reductase [Hahella chejuensis KCTC 2396]
MKEHPQLTFIGAGNMARAILGGLIANGYPANRLAATAPAEQELKEAADAFGIPTSTDNQTFMADCDALILCVKPQVMQAVCEGLADAVQQRRPLIVSIAAGVSCEQIEAWLGGDLPVVRCMPNTPAQVHLGASGLYANPRVSEAQREIADNLFSAVGIVAWTSKQEDIHTVTALSGSGPAYCFMFMEAMEEAAASLGLNPASARTLAIQTMRGAAELATRSEESPAQLKKRVMSPGGTTEQAIKSFEEQDMKAMVKTAIRKAWGRSYELSGERAPE